MRDSGELGDYSRDLISLLANKYIGSYRALMFSTRMNEDYRKYYSGYSNVSTCVPVGYGKTIPSAWIRYSINPLLKLEKVDIFHGLNEELPYNIDDDVKTVLTCYGPNTHHCNSLLDNLLWKHRMKYSFKRADIIVAVSEEVKQQIVATGIDEGKIVVIGHADNPMKMTEDLADQYFQLYNSLM